MDPVRASIEIAATPQEVWDVIMDPALLAEWVTIHRRVGKVDTPLKKGGTMEQTLCLRGVPFGVTWTVAEWEPPFHALMEGRGPARSRARTVDDLSESDGGTRFDYVNEFTPPMGPLGAMAGRVLVGGLSAREANASLRKLKSLVEKR